MAVDTQPGHTLPGTVAGTAADAPPATRLGIWREAFFVGLGYAAYSTVRNATTGHAALALRHAGDIERLERFLHIDGELPVNRFIARHHWLGVTTGYYYATLHFIVTVAVLVWLYRKHPRYYRFMRTSLVVACLVGLACFRLWPLAPPRLATAGYDDILITARIWGSLADGKVASASDQYAAMPSLHTAWAVWCAVALVVCARRRWVRVLGALYPCATIFVIIGTANHYVLDVVGGLVVLGVGYLAARPLGVAGAWIRAEAVSTAAVVRAKRTLEEPVSPDRP
ncbi:MAG TPA: phosphatase PAP2 family protein [Mycobacteriales bacterium]|nr:phosphatase PAP2 family protein [Mycobacteriales bacterium]